jgi:hypothetical protein
VGEGGRYACGLAWLIFTTDIVFWWFLQTYMTSGHCSCWFLLVIEQRIFLTLIRLLCWAAKNSLRGTITFGQMVTENYHPVQYSLDRWPERVQVACSRYVLLGRGGGGKVT